jgi:N-acyl-D-amino-acid deacylase
MIRRHDGRNFIALVNTRHTERIESLAGDLDQLLHRAANEVKEWPREDLFR